MTNDFQSNGGAQNGRRIINEVDYQFHAPKESGPACVGRGGDPLFMNIRATKEQLTELLDETTTVQDWVQRETCNNIALACLDNQNLREIYFEIKNGFADYGPIVLMGFIPGMPWYLLMPLGGLTVLCGYRMLKNEEISFKNK